MDSTSTLRQDKQPGGAGFICQTFGIKKWIYLNSLSPTFAADTTWTHKANVIARQYPSVLNVGEMYLLNVEMKSPPTPPDTLTDLYNTRQSMRRKELRKSVSVGSF